LHLRVDFVLHNGLAAVVRREEVDRFGKAFADAVLDVERCVPSGCYLLEPERGSHLVL
jgi:hypothetical protein